MKYLWPCDTCGGVGYRNVANVGYCADHLAELYQSFDPSHHSIIGYGLPDGAHQRCVRCGATWEGVIGQTCKWCWTEYDSLLHLSAQAVLIAPDVDIDDVRHTDALRAWAGRLERAVDTELITRQAAKSALQKEVSRREQAA